jgi:hypothetical protein
MEKYGGLLSEFVFEAKSTGVFYLTVLSVV